jgi:hypothetical protein
MNEFDRIQTRSVSNHRKTINALSCFGQLSVLDHTSFFAVWGAAIHNQSIKEASMKRTMYVWPISLLFFFCFLAANAQTLVATVPLSPEIGGTVTVSVDPATNLIYVGGSNPAAQPVAIVNGSTLAVPQPGSDGYLIGVNRVNDNYWAPGVYSAAVQVFDGQTNALLDSISLGYCPLFARFDGKFHRMWIGAQCGGGNDPVWAINPKTYAIEAGPLGTGGILNYIDVSSKTGVLYADSSNGCQRVNPKTFALIPAPFTACPLASDPVNGYLYVLSGSTTLQIWDGKTNPERLLTSVGLPYAPGGWWGENDALTHLYIVDPNTSSLDIRNSVTGAEIAMFAIPSSQTNAIAVDSTRGRVYIEAVAGNGAVLYVIDDVSTIRVDGTQGY